MAPITRSKTERARKMRILIMIEIGTKKYPKWMKISKLITHDNEDIQLAPNFKKIMGEEIDFALEDNMGTMDELTKKKIRIEIDMTTFRIYEHNIRISDDDLEQIIENSIDNGTEANIQIRFNSIPTVINNNDNTNPSTPPPYLRKRNLAQDYSPTQTRKNLLPHLRTKRTHRLSSSIISHSSRHTR